ncbi:DNA-binding transcriptional MerR regulator [Nocardiopsis sp. Huas11]|uniref:MerR family transcriptional regulator n=1 Tax=Nocardiopsis sp. Huas11 TaxID=2183912 RepID=UPI000EB41268|nr:MerR family transcriptional regulator [Nocardiopsis sp. Huas11]RKS05338.1 DNA-binding transcriptional MerR regulator [Nocardiopsis sp. Huas11]
MAPDEAGYKVGELARASGLTVRALRYYDRTGLLVPSRRTGGGHRLYGAADVRRLYRIRLLRGVGLPLAEIGRALDDPGWDLAGAVRHHLASLDRRMAAAHRLRDRLAAMAATLDREDVPSAVEFFEAMEEMVVLDSTVRRRISILVYDDIEAVHDHLVRVFGLGAGPLTRDDQGRCVHGEVDAGDGVIWLHREAPEFGLASPKSLGAASATTAVMVESVDEHYRRAVAEGARIVYEPVDQPYGYREYSARDPEGALWSFMAPVD